MVSRGPTGIITNDFFGDLVHSQTNMKLIVFAPHYQTVDTGCLCIAKSSS